MSNLQSANLPQVLANYSESVTALQAAELSFAKVQNLTLFHDICHRHSLARPVAAKCVPPRSSTIANPGNVSSARRPKPT